MYAARDGDYDECRSLLQQGADPDIRESKRGRTAVMYAARDGHQDIVQMLYEDGADLNFRDDLGKSALDVAVEYKKYPACQYLIHVGADYSRSETAVLELAADQGDLNMTQFLVEGGADVTKAPVLYCASYNGDLDLCQRWVQAGADVDMKNSSGYTPVNIAAKQGHNHLCEYFMELGADLNIPDDDGLTPLYFISQDGDNDLVKKLLDHGADVDSAGSLQVALDNYNNDVAETLIERGCNVNKVS